MTRYPATIPLIAAAVTFSVTGCLSATTLHIVGDHNQSVEISDEGRAILRSPAEGLWSVATGWKDNWPSDWKHAHPENVKTSGGWTILPGHIDLPEGRLDLLDSYRNEGDLVRCVRRFTWNGGQNLTHVTLSVRWVIPGAENVRPMLPGIMHYGNPMGGRDPKAVENFTVATHSGAPGEESLFEEHRYPIPMAVAEWRTNAGWHSAALHALPSPVSGGHLPDQWWSLGVVSRAGETELLQLSGPCAINGKRSMVKTFAHGATPYPDAWMDLRPGDIIEKTFFLQACADVSRGSGFREPVAAALAVHAPFGTAGLPSATEIVRTKFKFACSRWRDRPEDPGFEMHPNNTRHPVADPARPLYVMGWAGQAEAPAAALIRLSRRIEDPRAPDMARRSLDFLTTAPVGPGGFPVRYQAEKDGTGKWSGGDPVSMGQAMEGIARAIIAARDLGGPDSTRWANFLRKNCEIQSARILDGNWRPRSTGEAFLISPLCKAFALFGDETFKRAALKAAEHYAARHLDMAEPYWGGSLDASCEDKEAVQGALQGFLAIYEITKDPRHLEWAGHALDTFLTWTIVWDIPQPPGRLADHALKLRGFTTVSAQHHHADFFGITAAPDIWRMGELLRRDDLRKLAVVMFRSEGQMMDAWGSQGEQFNQTNFAMHGEKDLFRMRGSYSEFWTPFWTCAHFLTASAEFERMGVDLDQ